MSDQHPTECHLGFRKAPEKLQPHSLVLFYQGGRLWELRCSERNDGRVHSPLGKQTDPGELITPALYLLRLGIAARFRRATRYLGSKWYRRGKNDHGRSR